MALGFRVHGACVLGYIGFKVQGLGLKVQGIKGLRFRVYRV